MEAVKPHDGAGRGTLLLADISGYTAFLQAVAGAHAADTVVPAAYPLLTSLLDGIIERLAGGPRRSARAGVRDHGTLRALRAGGGVCARAALMHKMRLEGIAAARQARGGERPAESSQPGD